MSVESIEELPIEILLKICDYTTQSTNCYKRLYVFGCVCKIFYSVILIHPLHKDIDCIKRICACGDITCLKLIEKFICKSITDICYEEFKAKIANVLKNYGLIYVRIHRGKWPDEITIYVGDYNNTVNNIILECCEYFPRIKYDISGVTYKSKVYTESKKDFIDNLHDMAQPHGKIIYTCILAMLQLYKDYCEQIH